MHDGYFCHPDGGERALNTVAYSVTASRPLVRIGMPIAGGACIAALSGALLTGVSPLWVGLLCCAGLVAVPSLAVSDPVAYWLYLLLLSLPFDLSKMLANPDRAVALLETFGGPWGGPPELSLHVTDLLVIPLFSLWLLGKFRRRERIWFPRISYLPLAFLCFTSLTMLVAPVPFFAFLQVLRQWKYFLIYVFAADALDVRTLGKPILAILLLTLLMQGTLTIVRYRLQDVAPFFGTAFGRLTYLPEQKSAASITTESNAPERGLGTFYHANSTAMHLELLLPFALALGLSARSRRWKVLCVLLFAIGTAGLYVTFSRAGMIAFLTSTVFCLFAASFQGWIPRKMALRMLLIGLLASACLAPLLVTYLETRPMYSEYHFEHLRQGLLVALAHPLFGVGLNNSNVVRPFLVPEGLRYGEHLLPIHSQYLIGLSETGLIGFGLYVGFFVLVGIEALRRAKSADFYERTFALGVFGAFAAMSVHMVSEIMGPVPFQVIMWLYAGLIVAQRRPWPAVAVAARRGQPQMSGRGG